MQSRFSSVWNYPNRIVTGPGCISQLVDALHFADITKPFVVTDKGLADSPVVERVMALLNANGVRAGLFSDVQGNPTDANLNAGIEAYREGDFDGVIALGGGSALDVGKCVAFMKGQSRPVWDFEDVGDWWTRADPKVIAPIIAVPTTAGTGSEVGRAVVITNSLGKEKKIIFHPLMLPKVAIEDPELAAGLPRYLTVGTGFDALAHCFEAYCVDSFHPMADGIALEGMRIVKEYLPCAAADGNDLGARSYMFAAATMGGTAFQKGLGAIHAISHPVGAMFNTHHGMTNGVLFPYIVLRNREAITEKVERASRHLGLKTDFESFLGWLLDFRKSLDVPHTLRELGVSESDVEQLAAKATIDPTAATNPVALTTKDFEALILAAIRGDLRQ